MTYTVYVRNGDTGETSTLSVTADNFFVLRAHENRIVVGIEFYNKVSPYFNQNVAYFPGDCRVVAMQEAS